MRNLQRESAGKSWETQGKVPSRRRRKSLIMCCGRLGLGALSCFASLCPPATRRRSERWVAQMCDTSAKEWNSLRHSSALAAGGQGHRHRHRCYDCTAGTGPGPDQDRTKTGPGPDKTKNGPGPGQDRTRTGPRGDSTCHHVRDHHRLSMDRGG